jgi:cyanophycinase
MKQVLRWCVVLLVALSSAAAAAADGALVIIGGALRPDNAAVWQRVVQLAGGKGASIAVFASAAANPERSANTIAERLGHYGAAPFVVPVAVKLAGSDYRKAADDAALAAKVRAAGGAFFSGGDQGRITQALRRADGSNTRVLDALWDMYRAGGVIAGSSAGAAIMSSTMFHDAKGVLDTLRLGVRDGVELADGLGFIGNDVFIDQHLLVRGRFARMLPAMLKKGYRVGLGIDEDTALVVTNGQQVEVVGYKGALLVDLAAATSDPKTKHFNIRNARLSYLDQGDRYHLGTGAFVPSKEKAGGLLDRSKPYFHGPVFAPDILANTVVVDLMEKLVDGDQDHAIGIAFGGACELAKAAGFEFRFSRTPETHGFLSAVSEAYSIRHVRLDVRPIEMAVPLYR